jgi:hypothetical protein
LLELDRSYTKVVNVSYLIDYRQFETEENGLFLEVLCEFSICAFYDAYDRCFILYSYCFNLKQPLFLFFLVALIFLIFK